MNKLLFTLTVCFAFSVKAQVGIGTVTPDPSTILDVSATDKGILIPQISLNDVTNTMLDGVNTAATGLLIYNSNTSIVGGNGAGYYYFNGTIWEKLITTNIDDIDWYEEGGTTAPNDINDDIYTLGNVAIGKNTADFPFDVASSGAIGINALISGTTTGDISVISTENSNTGSGNHNGTYNLLTGSGSGAQTGTYNSVLVSGNGLHYGTYNRLANNGSGQKFGTVNDISTTSGGINQIGTLNGLSCLGNGSLYGTLNQFGPIGNGERIGTKTEHTSDGNGAHYGVHTTISGNGVGPKYGTYTQILSSAGGTQYGIYSDVVKSDSYAGYFLGNVSIGTVPGNNYILPTTRGTNGQVIQTDGSGNLGWVDTSTIGDDLGNHTATTSLNMNFGSINQVFRVSTLSLDNFDKLRVWGSSDNSIGMRSALTYGFLNDYAMTFTMNSDADTGWLWRDINDGLTDGAMSLTTVGQLTLKSDLRVDTNTLVVDATNNRVGIRNTSPVYDLQVKQSSITEGGAGGIGVEHSTNTNRWKIFHSGAHFSFAENGVRRGYITAGTGAYVQTSDKRLKKNLSLYNNVLSRLNALDVYTYHYQDQSTDSKKVLGFMAQDVLPLFPELVSQGEDGYLGLNYTGFGVVSIKAIQEQQLEIDALKSQLEMQQKELQEMKVLINQLAARN